MVNVVLVLVLSQVGEFQRVGVIEGVTVESRRRSGSSFVELRLRTTSPTSVGSLCDAAFGDGSIPKDDPWVRERKVLVSKGDERLTYERIRAPLVADRDYVMRLRRMREASRCVVQFSVVPDIAPLTDGVVRLTVLKGEWRFEAAGGQTMIEYTSHSEPGGGLAPFIVEGPRQSTEIEVVKRLVTLAARGL